MREFKKRRTASAEYLRVTLGVAGIAALLFIAFAMSRAAFNMYGKFAAAAAARSSAEAQLQELKAREAAIAADVEKLSTERGLEAAIRERYGVARPGEGEITIVRNESTSEAVRPERGFFESLWDLLFVW